MIIKKAKFDNINLIKVYDKGRKIMLEKIKQKALEEWSNRLLITELFVDEKIRGKGYGKQLIDLAKEKTVKQGYRVLMLETQSSNVNAVDFYLHQGFTLIGFDSCCYTNSDLERKEVRFNMGWFPNIETD